MRSQGFPSCISTDLREKCIFNILIFLHSRWSLVSSEALMFLAVKRMNFDPIPYRLLLLLDTADILIRKRLSGALSTHAWMRVMFPVPDAELGCHFSFTTERPPFLARNACWTKSCLSDRMRCWQHVKKRYSWLFYCLVNSFPWPLFAESYTPLDKMTPRHAHAWTGNCFQMTY